MQVVRQPHAPTNWWAPNHAAVEAMLRSAGLAPERIGHETYRCRPAHRSELVERELRAARPS